MTQLTSSIRFFGKPSRTGSDRWIISFVIWYATAEVRKKEAEIRPDPRSGARANEAQIKNKIDSSSPGERVRIRVAARPLSLVQGQAGYKMNITTVV